MQYGLTPPLAILPCSPFWTNDDDDHYHDGTITSSTATFIGIDRSYPRDGHVCQWLDAYSHMTAETAFEVINGIQKPSITIKDIVNIPQVEGTPPITPNAYSDGSFSNPKQRNFGLSTSAIWYPARNCIATTELENEFAKCQIEGEGTTCI
eukprot:11711985-Karenia_brevis.AAC.1